MDSLLLASLIVCLAAAAQAVTGFGFALVLVPLLALVYDPRLVVVVSISLGLACKLPLLVQSWRQVELLRIAPLCAAAAVGGVLGTHLLLQVDADALRLGIGVIVVVLASLLLVERGQPMGREGLAALGAGLVSGVLTGSTSMGGPPVVLLGVNQAWGKESFRANLLAFFMVSNSWSLVIIALRGAFTREVLVLDALLLPGLVVGLVLGNALFKAVPVAEFRRVVVLAVIATGLLSIWTGLQALLI